MPEVTAISGQTVMPISRLTNYERVFRPSDITAPNAAPARGLARPSGFVRALQHVTMEAMIVGVGPDNATITYDLYMVRVVGVNPDRDDDVIYEPLIVIENGVATLAAGVPGFANGYVPAATLFADAITIPAPTVDYQLWLEAVTDKGFEQISPADDANPAILSIPDIGGNTNGFAFHLKTFGTGVTAANVLASFWT